MDLENEKETGTPAVALRTRMLRSVILDFGSMLYHVIEHRTLPLSLRFFRAEKNHISCSYNISSLRGTQYVANGVLLVS